MLRRAKERKSTEKHKRGTGIAEKHGETER
jgi:hypothetical protein